MKELVNFIWIIYSDILFIHIQNMNAAKKPWEYSLSMTNLIIQFYIKKKNQRKENGKRSFFMTFL